MDQQEIELGGSIQISAEVRKRSIPGALEDLFKEQIRRRAELDGYKETQAPEVFWNEQAWKVTEYESGSWEQVRCDADDEGAFFNVGVKMKAVKVCQE